MISEYLGLEREAGLTTALVGTVDLNELLQPWGDDNLYVLTSGQIPPNPSELLGSEDMGLLISRLEGTFDVVIIDAPPLLPVTDAAVLSQHVGGVVVVVGVQKIRYPDLEKSLSALSLVGANLLGVVLNRLPAKGPDAYAYSYYSSEEPTAKAKRRKRASRNASPAHGPGTESVFDRTISGSDFQPAKVFSNSRFSPVSSDDTTSRGEG
ncbi:hypothetical protein StoSoilB19_30880 [Arthrobacter sp. StoSoilB19]|nr:hypothetical protein StoSoilB19_30880 [Arthrobacter sp. StoSoilB19]